MAADRNVYDSGSSAPVTGADYMDSVAEEIRALWNYVVVPLTSVAGTANAVTADCVVPISAYTNGMCFRLKAASSNTGAMTLNVDSIGVKSLVMQNGSAMLSGKVVSGGVYAITYDSAGDKFFAIGVQ